MPPRSPATVAADTKGEKLAQRISHIIARLHQGEAIDKHQLAAEFGTNISTIERDLHQRLHGIAERNAQGQWELAAQARSTIPAKHLHGYARMAGTEHLFPNSSLPYLLEQLDTPEQRRATHVQPVPHEDLNGNGSTPTFAHYFARRDLLPLQQHREDSDGSLLVTTRHINQLLPVVRYWLPYMC